MRHNTPDRTEELTTEDLANPSGGQGDKEPGTAAVYPGEATGEVPYGTERADDDGTPAGERDAADAGTDAYEEAAGTSAVAGAPSGTSAAPLGDEAPLLPESEAEGFRDQWARIQGGFVDDPRESVREADALVASVMQHLAGTFAERKGALEEQWQSGGEVATEDLRLALQRYRSFFNRLLTT
ncbi:hypothetical protein ABT024_14085 [Streptomyces sp. NPDC002812]|uniref:hypothetical protein n=1 Tax=Streptomyces sp. NPDC002812 TaxID=3154434 RepID=UPI00331A1120